METPNRSQLYLKNVQKLSTPLKIPASPFLKSLGYGTGVNVFRLDRSPKVSGEMRSPWAVKRISRKTLSNHNEAADVFNSRIQEEAKILRKLSHPNIVGFRGIQVSEDGMKSLILECCGTSLGELLEERKDEDLGPLPAKDTIKMVFDISRALDYLHTEAGYIHGDLKSFNVLVNGEFDICKLCDFGVSLPLDKNGLINFKENPNLRYVGTSLWSAPEIINDAEEIDCKADIFSFGLIIYETLALMPPHFLALSDEVDECELSNYTEDSTNKENSVSSVNSSTDEFKDPMEQAYGTRPPLPTAFELKEEYNIVVEIFYCCTNELAEDRPTAKVIWKSLEKEKITENKI